MTRIDQFESAFRASAKTRFRYENIVIKKALVVTDLDDYQTRLFADKVRQFLSHLGDVEWTDYHGDAVKSVGDLLDAVEKDRPDLICTYRHLHSGAWRWPYGLGEHLDVLAQVTTTPVLVMPRPDDDAMEKVENTDRVMAITSSLPGDHQLVNYAVRFTLARTKLYLTHVEDEAIYKRYVDIIGKLPSIDTRSAAAAIKRQLLKEAADYIESCIELLAKEGVTVEVEPIVELGHHLSQYKKLIQQHEIDLLVFNTKDDDQLAMHGLAYPLAVELRRVPMLML